MAILTCVDVFGDVEEHHPELVVVDSHGSNTGNVADFCKPSTMSEPVMVLIRN